jgi:ubiquinone/menaquinone biosynthesis C-methylase UbiE
VDICRQPLPFPDAHFSLVTFSEVLEHLPMERVSFVFMEMARVIRKGGVLLVSSPNQASLENRLRLLRGRSILDMPNGSEAGKAFGHIRLYTCAEVATAISRLGFVLEQSRMETNVSGFRGSAGSWRRRMYRWYEEVEQRLGVLQGMADTWYMAFRRT